MQQIKLATRQFWVQYCIPGCGVYSIPSQTTTFQECSKNETEVQRAVTASYIPSVTTSLAPCSQADWIQNCNTYISVSYPWSTHLRFCFINTLSASSVSPFSQSKSVNSTTLQQQFWTKIIFLLSTYNLEWPNARGQTISFTAQF